jgi:hypothetical protein
MIMTIRPSRYHHKKIQSHHVMKVYVTL